MAASKHKAACSATVLCFARVVSETSGHYPIDHRTGEIERLYIQGAAMAPDCAIMLDRIGVREGWRCLDLGCGPRGITPLLSERVGSTGKIVGLDADAG